MNDFIDFDFESQSVFGIYLPRRTDLFLNSDYCIVTFSPLNYSVDLLGGLYARCLDFKST